MTGLDSQADQYIQPHAANLGCSVAKVGHTSIIHFFLSVPKRFALFNSDLVDNIATVLEHPEVGILKEKS